MLIPLILGMKVRVGWLSGISEVILKVSVYLGI